MKKYLSLVLAIALVLTTLVVPMSASAAVPGVTVTLEVVDAEGNAINSENPAYAGDTVTVKAIANAETETSFDSVVIRYGYNKSNVTVGNITDTTNVEHNAKLSTLTYANNTGITIGTNTEVFTQTFTVNEIGATESTFDIKGVTSAYSATEDEEAAITPVNGTLVTALGAATAQIFVDDAYTNIPTGATTTYYSSTALSVKVDVTAGNLEYANVYLDDATEATYTLAADGTAREIATAGTYTVKVKVKGGAEATYTFTYVAQDIDAKVSIGDVTGQADGYERKAPITVPVSLEGLAEGAEASYVEFKVTYDKTVLSLATTDAELITYGDATESENMVTVPVLYGDQESGETPIGNQKVVDLAFTVLDAAAYGTTAITIEGVEYALETNSVDPTAGGELGVNKSSVNITVKPAAGEWPEITANNNSEWSAKAYTATVSTIEGVTVKYLATATEYDADDKETIYASADAKDAKDGIAVNDDEMTYYLVAAVGTEPTIYEYIGILPNWLDDTAPALNATGIASLQATLTDAGWTAVSTEALATLTLTVTDLAVDDEGSDIVGFYYSYDNVAWNDEAVTSISVNESKTALYIKAVDAMGNASEASEKITLYYDGDMPTVNAAEGGFAEDGVSKNINITNVGDTTSKVATIKVYNGESVEYSTAADVEAAVIEDAKIQTISYVEGMTNYTAKASTVGNYYVVVTDNAGNKTMVKVNIESLEGVVAAEINVKIDKDGEVAKAAFLTDEELKEYTSTKSNGTFTYINIVPVSDASLSTTLTLKKGEETVVTDATEVTLDATLTEGAAEAGEYVLTVTSVDVNDENNSSKATYTFSIAASQENMMSVNNNNSYNALDLGRLTKITKQGAVAAPADTDKFTGGLFSADVNADLQYSAEDVTAVLNAIRGGKFVGIYDFAIMNGIVTENAVEQ